MRRVNDRRSVVNDARPVFSRCIRLRMPRDDAYVHARTPTMIGLGPWIAVKRDQCVSAGIESRRMSAVSRNCRAKPRKSHRESAEEDR